MKSTPNKAANAPVLNANQKLHDLVLEYLAVTIEALDWSMVETMEVLLDILTPEDMEQLGLGDTMREYLAADDKDEECIHFTLAARLQCACCRLRVRQLLLTDIEYRRERQPERQKNCPLF